MLRASLEAARMKSVPAEPERMRFFLGLVLEAEQDPELRARLAGHMREFNAAVAQQFGREPGDVDVDRVLVDLL